MTLKKPQCLTEHGYIDFVKLQVQYDKVVEQNKRLQQCMRLINDYDFINIKYKSLRSIINEIENFIESVKRDTPDYESDSVLGKILKIINETEEVENERQI